MPKTLGYMLTWTTYVTWLQGDERRYVKKGQTFPANEKLFQANKELQAGDAVRLSLQQKKPVRAAIMKEAGVIGQQVLALDVCSNHVHLVLRYIPKPVADIVAYYKKACRLALKEIGLKGKIWARGYDKRFCFDHLTLDKRITYVQNHNIKQKPWVRVPALRGPKPRSKLSPGFTGG